VENTEITFIKWDSGDWLQMYVGEKLVYEGHSISATMALEYAGIPFERHEVESGSEAAESIERCQRSRTDVLMKLRAAEQALDK
jgi:hypothetical protein